MCGGGVVAVVIGVRVCWASAVVNTREDMMRRGVLGAGPCVSTPDSETSRIGPKFSREREIAGIAVGATEKKAGSEQGCSG